MTNLYIYLIGLPIMAIPVFIFLFDKETSFSPRRAWILGIVGAILWPISIGLGILISLVALLFLLGQGLWLFVLKQYYQLKLNKWE